jgi:PIN domain nuclease of toxin-antitoxin system
MSDAVTDTHGLIWYLEDSPRLGPAANKAFDACERGEAVIYVPTICLVEMIYLQEKGRISADLLARFTAGLHAGTSGLAIAELTASVVNAVAKIPRAIVPDMPDRIIAATALDLELPLITRDSAIIGAGLSIIW